MFRNVNTYKKNYIARMKFITHDIHILFQIIVCIIDFIYPPKEVHFQGKKKNDSGKPAQEKDSDDEELVENVKDDLVDEEGSESEKPEGDKDLKSNTSSPNFRKRKPRKAD